ncbi:MAG: AGE family epimerase/isomerase [Rhodobacteraceae bacterium]|nr:AGE family epimerase/isomerase [Paracoccaceae bacterium]
MDYPDFENKAFLEGHIKTVQDFYRTHAIDKAGGFFHTFTDDGTIFDPGNRHLVSSCRFIVNFARSYSLGGPATDLDLARHGLKFLEQSHRRPDGSYAWELRDGKISDHRGMAYGHAFVVLAAARALSAGIEQAKQILTNVWDLMEHSFWEPEHNAYCDEFENGIENKGSYRGQNANMHMCEASIAAWEATGDEQFLDRAVLLAKRFAGDMANSGNGLVWEHYKQDWAPDYDFNREAPDDLFRPWGYQPGHQVEWARLLLILDVIRPDPFYLDRARHLYLGGMKHGRDTHFGGIFYGFSPDGMPCSTAKYYWVHSEAIAAAWRLYRRTGDESFAADYHEFWRYSWDHFVDHDHGAWFRILTRDGRKVDNLKSPPGKTDYHTLGVCWDLLGKTGGSLIKRQSA